MLIYNEKEKNLRKINKFYILYSNNNNRLGGNKNQQMHDKTNNYILLSLEGLFSSRRGLIRSNWGLISSKSYLVQGRFI